MKYWRCMSSKKTRRFTEKKGKKRLHWMIASESQNKTGFRKRKERNGLATSTGCHFLKENASMYLYELVLLSGKVPEILFRKLITVAVQHEGAFCRGANCTNNTVHIQRKFELISKVTN